MVNLGLNSTQGDLIQHFVAVILSIALSAQAYTPYMGPYTIPQAKDNRVDPVEAPATAHELIQYYSQSQHQVLTRHFMESAYQNFHRASRYLGHSESIDSMALSMFRQWLYMQIYSVFRDEYFLVNISKLLPLRKSAAIRDFDRLFPAKNYRNYPKLNTVRNQIRHDLKTSLNSTSKKKELRDFTRGQVEGQYLTLSVLEKRKEDLARRYRRSDSRYENGVANIERWKEMTKASHGLLKAKAFTRSVEPYLHETKEMLAITEEATARFTENFAAHVQSHETITDLSDFLSGNQLTDLGVELLEAIKLPSQQRFRQRIERAFDRGVDELYTNLETELEDFRSKQAYHDYSERLITSNTRTNEDNSKFHDWLVQIFKEQPLHWVITEEYSFLKRAADDLTTLVTQRLRERSLSSAIRLSLLTALVAITPLSRTGNQFSGWLTRRAFTAFRVSLVVANAYVLSQFAFETYLRYSEWRQVKRLSRLSLDTGGLMNQAQEDAAYWSLLIQGGLTGVSALTSLGTLKSFFLSAESSRTFSSPITRAAMSTWQGKPIPFQVWRRQISKHSLLLKKALSNAKPVQAAKYLAMAGMDVAAIFTQAITMVPASLPTAVRTFLGSVPRQLYKGITLGTVMGIMGVTVQSYINAMGLKSFVWAFDRLGFVPPAYWQQNTLNVADRVERSAILTAEEEMIYTKSQIANQVGYITSWEVLLEQGNLSSSQRRKLQGAIKTGRESIQNLLKFQLLRWYLLFEYRKYAHSAMKDLGFGLQASPNLTNPTRMTIFIKIGDDTFSYGTTAAALDNLRDRVVEPNNVDPAELDNVIAALGGSQ